VAPLKHARPDQDRVRNDVSTLTKAWPH